MVQNATVAAELARSANKTNNTNNSSSEEEIVAGGEDGDDSTILTQETEDEVEEDTGTSSTGCIDGLLSNFLENNQDCTHEVMMKSIKILYTLIDNLSSSDVRLLPLNNPKRRIRYRNPKINEFVVSKEGAVDILLFVGFELKVKDHEEWLIFSHGGDSKIMGTTQKTQQQEQELEKIINNLRTAKDALSNLLKDLERGRKTKFKKSNKTLVSNRKQEAKQERKIAMQRWKEDNNKESNTRITNRARVERRQEKEIQQQQAQAQKWIDTIRPYVLPVCLAGMALLAMENPAKLYYYAIFAFCFYWVSIFFTYWVEHGMPILGVRITN